MLDAYPLALFTIKNVLRVSQDNSVDSFIYLVIYSLWQSALLKKSFSKEMRQILLEVVFCLIWEDYCLILSLRRSGRLTVGEKRTVNSCDGTLAPLGKMRRILITILVQINAIRFHSDTLGLDHIGSHIGENYIGTIRQRCRHNHKHETVFRAVSRIEFVKFHMPDLGFVCQLSSRANLGGTRLTSSGYSNVSFESPVQLADSFLLCLRLSAPSIWPKVVPPDDIIHWMIDVALNAPSGAIPFCSVVGRAQIVSRLLLFRPSTQIQAVGSKLIAHLAQSRTWSIPELQLVKGAVSAGVHDISTLEFALPAKRRKQVAKKFRDF
jgi:hypothetical protein